ncbi:uncharacterized protein LOC114535974 [Dendronephthya gigantea]|uniref:uncharacterized protein LOC114535974 n=1 Tax=Dendronephthya gigantea TaxID=151771 RepID=UPI0010692857|nr:uncharacterized protein LOC114535974 [Dendronephthya gigantea]XP_028413116.1 uncharacterized protein LOC114535974 [Dendronephthya gigantea]XP_028413117.1 uncharacterized protein LOC114535974 [Dendronephthya gigantea]XP_028413118.1 uncharacterized protein LOC114535974 [Dendronephthya gigantea]
MASVLVSFFVIYLVCHINIVSSGTLAVNIELANREPQYFGQFSRAAINVTLNISSFTNVASSLEQCADAGHPYLFVQNTTILGCGTLLRMENDNIPSNCTLNVTSAFRISASGTMIPFTDHRVPASVQTTDVLVLTTSYIPSNDSQADGFSNVTLTPSPNDTLLSTLQRNVVVTETISPSNTTALMSYNVLRLNSTHSVGTSDSTQILSIINSSSASLLNATLPTNATIQPSGVMVNDGSSLLVANVVSSIGNYSVSPTPLLSTSMVDVATTIFPRINTTYTQDIEPSNTSSAGPSVNALFTTRKCRNASMQNVTELVKAYKTEYFRKISIAAFTNVNYTLRLPNYEPANCSFISGDKAPVVLVKTNTSLASFSHRYFRPGRYNARVSCIRNETVVVDAYKRVVVDLPVVLNGLSCPNLVQTDEMYHCVFNVKQALALNMTVAIGDKKGRQTLAETVMEIISVDEALDLRNITLGIHSPLLTFKKAMFVRCIELESTISATINLKVFRPVGDSYNTSRVSIGSLCCFGLQNPSICFQSSTNILSNSSYHLPNTRFSVIHNISLTIDMGDNFLTLTDDDVFEAQPGDVIGYTVVQSRHSDPSPVYTSALPRNTTSVPVHQSNSSSSLNIFQNFSLYGFVPYETQILIHHTSPGVLSLGITIDDFESVVSTYRNLITIQTPISGLELSYKDIIMVNTSRSLGFKLSRGTNATCDWLLTGHMVSINGSVNSSSWIVNKTLQNNETNADEFEGLVTSFQYPHNIPADLIFLVNCSNEVSTITENVTISVRRNISHFKASLKFASFAYAHAQTSWTCRAQGEHVGYTWTFDHYVYYTAEMKMEFQSRNLPGNKTKVSVKAWNVVSERNLLLSLDVLHNPLRIQVLPALTVASREYVNITPVLSWSPRSNGIAFYADYGINISSTLRKFIEFPTFTINVGDFYTAQNISNGTSLNYKFSKVGSETRSYTVYIEAKDHQEMNRKVEIRVLDKIKNLRIIASDDCSNDVVINTACTFTAKFSLGSDVRCNWIVGTKKSGANKCKIDALLNKLGNLTISVEARNEISSETAVINISVVPEPKSLSVVLASTITMARLKPSHGSITTPLGNMTSFTKIVLPQSNSVSNQINPSSSSRSDLSSRTTDHHVLQITGPKYAAVDEEVMFHVLNISSARRRIFSWIVNNTKIETTNNSISYTFRKSGEFEVAVSTFFPNQTARTAIIVQYRIFGFKAFVYQKPHHKRVDVLFAIVSGTDVNYSVDFGDSSAPNVGKVRKLERNISVYYVYTRSGLYNLTVSVFSIIGPNDTENFLVYVNDTCKFESVTLYGASENVENSRKFSEKEEIVMTLKTTLNCTKDPQLKYSWKVERLDNSTPDGLTIRLPPFDGSTLRLLASQLNIGDYKVQAIVENPMDGGSCETRIGYFSKVLETLAVHITCGKTRMIPVGKPLIMNATVIAGSAGIKFEWFCDRAFNVTCFGNRVQRNTSLVRFPGNFFRVGEIYEFVVQVNDKERHGRDSQKVEFGFENSTLDLCIISSQANKHFVLSTKEVKIISLCSRCPAIPDLTWTWRVLKISSKPNSTKEDEVNGLNVKSRNLYIPPNALQPDSLYKIQVNTTSLALNISGYVVYDLRTNDVPKYGFCNIETHESFTPLKAFQTVCRSWYDKDQPLSYEFWYSNDGVNYSLFYNGLTPDSGKTFLKPGKAERGYVVSVKVVIKDYLGESTVQILPVENLPPSDNETKQFFASPQQMNNQVEKMVNESNIQGAVQFLKTVTGLLNENSNENEEDVSKGTKVRESILDNLKKLCCRDGVVIEQTADTISSVASVPSQLSLDAQLQASTIYINMTQNLHLISKRKVKKVVEKLANALSLLMSAVAMLGDSTSQNSKVESINKASLLAIDRMGDALLHQTKPGEPALVLSLPSFIVVVQKHFVFEFPGKQLAVPNHITEFIVPRKLRAIQGPFVSSKMTLTSDNPFSWQNSSHGNEPTTGVASLVLTDSQQNEIKMNSLAESFHIFLDNQDSSPKQHPLHHSPQSSAQSTLPPARLTQNSSQSITRHNSTLTEESAPDLYQINTTRGDSAIMITITQISADYKGQLRMRVLKADQSMISGSERILSTTSAIPVSLTWRSLLGRGTYYVSVRFESLSFRRAGVPNSIKYSLSFGEISCHYWNVTREEWMANGCKVGLRSTTTATHCECNHLTWFAGRVVVPPNSLSLVNIAERIEDPSNYITILCVFACVFIIYLLVLVWARRRDEKDEVRRGITWCPSNRAGDSNQYQVIIHTGIRRSAGTSANVGLMLSGEHGKSRKCLLKSSKREVLQRGDVDSFLITTTGSLGALKHLYIWHDNTGSDPAWFLNHVVVLDSETGQVYNFLCYRWLAVDEGDGQIMRLLPLAKTKDLKRFRHLFVSRATNELTDAHLWFSVVFCSPTSPFTRAQRVSCCLTLLLSSMMANAMWYETGGGENAAHINLGLFMFSWDEVAIGICSSLVVFPINLILVQVFRHCRSKTKKPLNRPSKNTAIKQEFLNLHTMTHGSRAKSAESRALPALMSSHLHTSAQKREVSQLSYTVTSSQESLLPARILTPSLPSLPNSSTPERNRAKHKHLLPHWFQYLGWIGVIITCVTSAAITFKYAIKFGEVKTRKWLLSLTISVITDVFIAQPSKVLFVTVILAYILKRPPKERYASYDVIQQEVAQAESTQETELEAPDFNLSAADEFLRAARKKREKERFMYGIMKDVFYHMCFTLLVLIIAYGQRDLNGYHLTATQRNTFVLRNFKERSLKKQSYKFSQVANVNDFWLWNRKILLPGLSNNEWHNYSNVWSTFTANFGGFLFGAARMRQKRLKKGVCKVLPKFKDIIEGCSGTYEWKHEDEASYERSWSKPSGNNLCNVKNDSADTLPRDLWCYTRLSKVITASYVGRLDTYSPGGYSEEMRQNYQASLNLTQELMEHNWIDKYTRAVFIEFTLYNPNVNLFSIVTLLFEVSASGDFNPLSKLLSIRLYNYVGNFQIVVLICQLLFLLSICVYTYNSMKGIFGEKWGYISKPWNFYELVIVIVSWVGIAIYLFAMVFRKRILQEFRKDPTKFTSFVFSASWQMTLEYVIASIVFLVSLKFLRLFQFNRRMFLLPLTLSNTARDLISYTVVFSVVLTAFALLYQLILRAYNPDFLNTVSTLETLLRVLLGRSDLFIGRYEFPALEQIIFFTYMCLMKFILLNIFVAILNDGFSRARAKNDRQRNAFDFFDFIRNTVNELLGIRRQRIANKAVNKSSPKRRRVRFEDEAARTNVENMLAKMETKMEKLLNLVQSDLLEDSFYDEMTEEFIDMGVI